MLGDEGSGDWLALQSIKAALADREASGPRTALSAAAIEFFDVQSVEVLAGTLREAAVQGRNRRFRRRSRARVAYAGDEVARGLYMRAAKELAGQIAAVVEQTGLRDQFLRLA